MDKIIIECVWYNSKRDFNRFVRGLKDKNLSIIDYSLIKNKLIKADPYENEPHDSIIGLNIINMIKSCFDDNKKTPEIIVYSFFNMNLETVINFKELIHSYTDGNHIITLNVLNMEKLPNKSILNKFDCVKFIDND